jgi:hypothetical protein
MNTGTMCIYVRKQLQQVDAVEQRYMVNSGVGDTKDRNLRTEVYWQTALMRVSYLLSTLSHASTECR